MENAGESQVQPPKNKLRKVDILVILVSVFIVITLINSYAIFFKGSPATGNAIVNTATTPSAAAVTTTKTVTQTPAATPAATQITKSDKPKVEVFIMSYCPYGTQIEKGIVPVAQLLKDKIDFSIKFVYYAMHGQKEIDENTRQYCIEKEQTSKFNSYLTCFLQAGDSPGCLKSTGIDSSKLDACTKEADNKFSITKNFADNSLWLNGKYPKYDVHAAENKQYGVTGSPTLVINGVKASLPSRDSATILKTICGAFNTAPSECSQTLSSASPSPGFGTAAAAASTGTAGCGG